MSSGQSIPTTVKCPTCGADHRSIERQSLKKRAGKAVAFGVFAARSIAKTFKCTKCGFTW